ncbi:MAG: response regulator transcription factor [Cyanobacteria bacterium]|nr:response regulator transcription factor [Cyanobacteriota bacterium]MDA1246382.1 response regulator transcription factor [Cyanobacteriota bacterium]
MDFTPRIEQIRRNTSQIINLLKDARLVACLGNRALLCALVGGLMGEEHLVGAATCEAAGLALVERQRPSMVFLSDTLEQGSGVSLLLQLKKRWPSILTLLLITQEHRQNQIQAAIEAGCDGLLVESRLGPGTAMAAMHAISEGGVYLDRSLMGIFRREQIDKGPTEPLTARELQVLSLVAQGKSNIAIGQKLFISAETAKTHMRSLCRKLQARDRAHAAVLGLRWGLFDWSEG